MNSQVSPVIAPHPHPHSQWAPGTPRLSSPLVPLLPTRPPLPAARGQAFIIPQVPAPTVSWTCLPSNGLSSLSINMRGFPFVSSLQATGIWADMNLKTGIVCPPGVLK